MKILGIGGLPRSGKDSLAELFMHEGYFGLSFGDVVRGFCFARHKDKPDPISVANMTETSNWLRETRGPDVILQEALKQYQDAVDEGRSYKGLVLWSIRAPIEVDFILGHQGNLVWMDAKSSLRYQRAMNNMRDGEVKISLEEFNRQEQLQWQPQPGADPSIQMDLSYVKTHATHVFENDSDNIEVFRTKAKELMEELWR